MTSRPLLGLTVVGGENVRTDYAIAYEAPRAGQYYVRLVQVDLDGAVTYSSTTSVELTAAGVASLSALAVASDWVGFQSSGGGAVRLLDLHGRSVATVMAAPGAGVIEMAGLPRGFYVLTDGRTSLPFVR